MTDSDELEPREEHCVHCGRALPEGDLLWIAEGTSLPDDPRLGSGSVLRFLPGRFDAQGRALDPSGFPTTTLACPDCRGPLAGAGSMVAEEPFLVQELDALESTFAKGEWSNESTIRIERVGAELQRLLSLIGEWIDAGLLCEPLEFSEASGNLVRLADRYRSLHDRACHEEVRSWDEAVEKLNHHFLAMSEVAGPLKRLRAAHERGGDPLERIECWKTLRRRLPRARGPLEAIHLLEGALADWMLEPMRTVEEKTRIVAFLDRHRPLTDDLESAEARFRGEWEETLRSRLAAEFETAFESVDLDDSPTEVLDDLATRIEEALGGGELPPGVDWMERVARLRDSSAKRLAAMRRALEAETALAELERVLDEQGGLRVVENAYARARELNGPLGEIHESRVRRRLGIEKAVRLRRNAGIAVVALAVLCTVGVLGWWKIEADRRQALLESIAAEARQVIEDGRPGSVDRLLDEALSEHPELSGDPLLVAVRADAASAIEVRENLIEDGCLRVATIRDRIEAGDPVAVVRADLESVAAEPIPRVGGEFDACLSEARRRLEVEEQVRVDRAIAAWAPSIDEAEVFLETLETEGPARRQDQRFDPTAWARVVNRAEMLRAALEATSSEPEEGLAGLEDWRRRADDVMARLVEAGGEAEAERTRLESGLAAVRGLDEAVRSEREFARRLQAVLTDRPGFLEQIGRYSSIEGSFEVARTLVSLEDWRNSFSRVVLAGLDGDAGLSVRRKARETAADFVSLDRRTPHLADLEFLDRLLAVDAADDRPRGDELGREFEATGLVDLSRSDTRLGWIYLRRGDAQAPVYLLSEVDLGRDPRELPKGLRGVELVGTPEPAVASAVLARGIAAMASVDGTASAFQLLSLLADVQASGDVDSMLVLAMLRQGWRTWLRHFESLDEESGPVIREWLSKVALDHPAVDRFDWVKGGMEASRRRSLWREAGQVVAAGPSAESILARLKGKLESARRRLQPTMPVAVAAAARDATSPRAVSWLDGVEIRDGLLVAVLDETGSNVVFRDARFDEQGRLLPVAGAPRGPLLVMRRQRTKEES